MLALSHHVLHLLVMIMFGEMCLLDLFLQQLNKIVHPFYTVNVAPTLAVSMLAQSAL